jgi:peroxiredoxin
MKSFLTAVLALFILTKVSAQAPYQIGSKVENFTLKDFSNKEVSFQSFADRKAVVVVFTNNNCPYAKLYDNRLVSMAKSYSGQGVQFILINPSVNQSEGGESLQDMAAKASSVGYVFPYLADEGQKVSSRFGASKTPEAFLLHNVNGTLTLKYKGAIDDNPQAENFVKDPYLKNALEAVLKNQPIPVGVRRATGCMIRRI